MFSSWKHVKCSSCEGLDTTLPKYCNTKANAYNIVLIRTFERQKFRRDITTHLATKSLANNTCITH